MNHCDADVLVIGAGPAGASVAIRLACAGWRVAVIEQARYPRQKVCGECLSPSSLLRLDELGIADRLRELASPEIRRVAWMTRKRTAIADMPACRSGPHPYGRAIGRDLLDALLLERARELGVRIIQPARARRLCGTLGEFVCEYRSRSVADRERQLAREQRLAAPIVVDAHGSWERGLAADTRTEHASPPETRGTDLVAFKATFSGAALPCGLLPVLSLPGGYGGIVVSDRSRTTVACCIRRDVLHEWRLRAPGSSAGVAVEEFLRTSCQGVAKALSGARREEAWHSIGPLRPGFHARNACGVFSVGNAAAEAHPLIGEGISMALESAALLATLLGSRPSRLDERVIRGVYEAYTRATRAAFARRLWFADVYSRLAMHQPIAAVIALLFQSWPQTLTFAAQLAGKTRTGSMAS